MDDFCALLVTCSKNSEAQKIANVLVASRLAACVNIIPQVESVYRWQDKVETAREVMLVIKSRMSLLGQIRDSVKQHHSYACPEVIALPITAGDEAYLGWLRESTLGL